MTPDSSLSDPSPLLSAINREANHRIANNLAIISGLVRGRARKGNVIDPTTFLLEIADRIDAVGKLHRLLADSDSDFVPLRQYFQEVCECVTLSVARRTPLITYDCSPQHMVPSRVALPLGYIITELFTNSLKYAHPADLPVKIGLSCTRNERDELVMVYEDDGVGFPEGFDLLKDGHIGMRVIKGLSDQLKARYKWSSDPLGIRFKMVVPMCAKG